MAEYDYAAFLSYNSADRDAARRLQRALESYSIPRALRGQSTSFGLVGERIGKVCRDRTDFKSGESLNAALIDALDRSSALVVLCSPASAASKWVNAEIEHFQKTGRSARIFPVVVETDATGVIVNSYPPALRRDDGDEAIAADLQDGGDGWPDGVLKVLASILDVDYDALRQRALVAARRRARIAYGIAGGMAALAVAAVAAGALAIHQRNRAMQNFEDAIRISARSASRINELNNETAVPRPIIYRFLTETDQDLRDLSALEAMSQHPRVKRAFLEFELLLSDLYSDVGRSKDQLLSSLEAERWIRSIEKDAADPRTRFINAILFGEQSVDYFADELSGEVDQSLGAAYASNGLLEKARVHFGRCLNSNRAAIDEWELEPGELAEFRNDALSCAAQQANVMAMLNEPGAAMRLIEERLPDAGDLPAHGFAKLVLAQLYADNSRLGASIRLLGDEISRRDTAAAGRQERIELVKLLETRAKALAMTGAISAAASDLARADALLGDFLANDAADRRVLLLRAELLTTSAEADALGGDRTSAKETFDAALEIFGRLIAFDKTRRDWRLARARLYIAQADNAFRIFEADAAPASLALAKAAARAAIADIKTVASEGDEVAGRLHLVADVSLARALRLGGDEAEARRLLAAAAGFSNVDADAPPARALRLAMIDDERGDLAEAAGKHTEATASYDKAIKRFDAYLAGEPEAGLVVRDLLWTLMASVKAASAGGDTDGARRRLAKACVLKTDAALSEYSLFVRDAKTLDAMARETGVEC